MSLPGELIDSIVSHVGEPRYSEFAPLYCVALQMVDTDRASSNDRVPRMGR